MKIDDIQEADNAFPFPKPGSRSMDNTEMLLLKARLALAVQRAAGTPARVSHADDKGGALQE